MQRTAGDPVFARLILPSCRPLMVAWGGGAVFINVENYPTYRHFACFPFPCVVRYCSIYICYPRFGIFYPKNTDIWCMQYPFFIHPYLFRSGERKKNYNDILFLLHWVVHQHFQNDPRTLVVCQIYLEGCSWHFN